MWCDKEMKNCLKILRLILVAYKAIPSIQQAITPTGVCYESELMSDLSENNNQLQSVLLYQ